MSARRRGTSAADVAGAMRRDWDARAALDPWHYVLYREPGDWRAEGERVARSAFDRFGYRPPAGARVVEIGCGPGRLTWGLARSCGHVTALDVSPRMVELARANLADAANVDVRLGDGLSLADVPDVSAELVFSGLTLQHLPAPALVEGYVREAGRVLVPGGALLVQVNNEGRGRFAVRRAVQVLRRPVSAASRRLESGRTWTGTRVDLRRLGAVLRASGFASLRSSGAGGFSCWVHAVKESGGQRR